MAFDTPLGSSALNEPPKAWALIGPYLAYHRAGLRYGYAVLITLVVCAARYALVPILGNQAPLLPCLVAVVLSTLVGGARPAILAGALAAIFATVFFTAWPYGTHYLQWSGHVALFVFVTACLVGVIHALQEAHRGYSDALHAAMESERRLLLLADHLPALVSYVDREGRYQFANSAYRAWFGLDATGFLGLHLRAVLGEQTYEERRAHIEKALQGQHVQFDGTMRHRALGVRDTETIYVPNIDRNGRVLGFFVMVHDITEYKQALRDAGVQADKALCEADRRRDQFLALLAHELRNPLAPLRNVGYILSQPAVDTETVNRTSQILQRQVTHLTRIVDELLDVSRITRGVICLRKERLPLASVLDAAIESVNPLIASKYQELRSNHSGTALWIEGDSLRLEQIVENLLDNAALYSPEHSMIELAVAENGGNAVITVRDHGAGIEAEVLPHIFELFVRANGPLGQTQAHGLGVGLSLVKSLVELHGGQVSARSAGAGRGSEFVVRLPLARSAAPEASRT